MSEIMNNVLSMLAGCFAVLILLIMIFIFKVLFGEEEFTLKGFFRWLMYEYIIDKEDVEITNKIKKNGDSK